MDVEIYDRDFQITGVLIAQACALLTFMEISKPLIFQFCKYVHFVIFLVYG